MNDRYAEWLKYVFNRPETTEHWYFDWSIPDFEAKPAELTEFITRTCRDCATDLAGFSDWQINAGLNYIFSNVCSNCVYTFRDISVPLASRLDGIRAIATLYSDCFARRCSPVLSHLNEHAQSALNNICYMLWDVTPLAYWEETPHKEFYYAVVVEVLESALHVDHPACIEGALHGLGHVEMYAPEAVARVIDKWLPDARISPALREYALNARRGYML